MNLYWIDVCFEKDVYSRFKKVDDNCYRFFKDDVQCQTFHNRLSLYKVSLFVIKLAELARMDKKGTEESLIITFWI